MNDPDVRKLLGGYATGSLTEAERQRLFDAALEDQELFDQIAGEHALKEILEGPGARARLLAALEPKTRWSFRPWPWAAGAAALLSAVAIIAVLNRTTPPPPQEVAQVMKTELPAPPPEPVQDAAKPRPAAAPARTKVAPEAPKTPLPEIAMDQVGEARVDESARGGGGQAAPRAGVAASMAFKALPAFSFHYNVGTDGILEVTPSAAGFLSVTAGGAAVFPSRAVAAGMPVRIPIPVDAVDLVVGFSAVAGTTGVPLTLTVASGTVADQNPPNERILVQIPARP